MKCSTGKIRHENKSYAYAALRRIKNAGLNVYQCNECQGWHLGNSSKDYKIQQRIDQILKKEK